MRRLILTTGDLDGVGCEIAAKALREIRFQKNQNLTVLLHPTQKKEFQKHFGAISPVFSTIEEASSSEKSGVALLFDDRAPAHWVETAARACDAEAFDALVTGPLSKPGIFAAGLKDLGHTEILARVTGCKDLYMSFWGRHFNVVLVTGHIPLSQVPKKLTTLKIKAVADLTRQFLKDLKDPRTRRPLAWLGLNPHAGDKGLIGFEEKNIRIKSGTKLIGPLVPDSAFQRANWRKYSAFLCAYHDQGLIAFKMAHGFDEGVHVTLGLPFLRTSVDHGPAVELVGTGKAKFGSMKAAIQLALDFKSRPG